MSGDGPLSWLVQFVNRWQQEWMDWGSLRRFRHTQDCNLVLKQGYYNVALVQAYNQGL